MKSPINQVSLIVNQLKDHIEPQIAEWTTLRIAQLTNIKQHLDQPELVVRFGFGENAKTLTYRRFSTDWYYHANRLYGKITCQMLRHAQEQDIVNIAKREAEDKIGKMQVAVRKKLDGIDIQSVERGVLRGDVSGGFSGTFTLKDTAGVTYVFGWEAFLAGGHNVQCLHLRTKYRLKKVKG
jgi:hypothetical protein